MSESYYDIAAAFRPGWQVIDAKTNEIRTADTKRWRNPPHEYLANLGWAAKQQSGAISKEDKQRFLALYGELESIDGKPEMASPEALELIPAVRHLQAAVRAAWRSGSFATFLDVTAFGDRPAFSRVPVAWGVTKDGRLELRAAGVYWYVQVLLARDLAEGRAKFCKNSTCVSPFFIANRRDAIYCSHTCAVAVNVRNLRQRESAKSRRRKKR